MEANRLFLSQLRTGTALSSSSVHSPQIWSLDLYQHQASNSTTLTAKTTMEEVFALASQCRVATPSDTVVHSECAYTFFSPFSSPQGILVNCSTFAGTIQELAAPQDKQIYLRIVKERKEKKNKTNDEGSSASAPTKLAIGVEGGFEVDENSSKYEVITQHSVVVVAGLTAETIVEVPYDDATQSTFPEAVVKSVESIIHHVGLAVQQDLTTTAWQDDEEVPVSKYYQNLPFVDNGVKISPHFKDWKCEKSGATENLWLNLSDGFIGGGRKNWDGSGGSNGALDHFQETGEIYPLVVKLGTITTEGTEVLADCFSYAPDEDGPVKIPNLKELLAKRGIQVAGMQKTEKSTAELEVELNANYAFDAITERGSKLVPVTGPGLQGLQNLGNSCYLNSVVQSLAAVPEFAKRYASDQPRQNKFGDGVTPRGAPHDLLVQTSKLATALVSGAYAMPQEELDVEGATTHPKYRLAPRMFKHLIGKDHVDFRTGQQQDAAQFLLYLLEQLDRAELKKDKDQAKTSVLFSFELEDRVVCSADQKIKYVLHAPESIWSLRVPMEKSKIIPTTDNEPEPKKLKQEGDDEEEKLVPTVAFSDCVDSWSAESTLDDYRWPHLNNAAHTARQTSGFRNFPRYLWIQIQRYELGPDWQPIKLEVNLDIPEEIDLSPFKSKGTQDGEELVPEEGASLGTEVSVQPEISEAALCQLMDMGFGMNGCKRALIAVGGSDAEAAMNWIFEHNMDPDFDDPLPEDGGVSPAAAAAAAPSSGSDDAVVMSLVESLGCFTIDQVRAALKETNGAADRAADWLFSHMDDLDGAIASLGSTNEGTQSVGNKVPLEDGEGKYTMMGMVSHIGKNTGSGHYVAHIKRNGKWVIYNDEKVAMSENPPLQHAYLYLFQRTDAIGSTNPGF